jgi:hypothetical protein
MSQSESNTADIAARQLSDEKEVLFYTKLAEISKPIEVGHSVDTGYPAKCVTILAQKDVQEPTPSQIYHARSKPRTFPIVDKLRKHRSRHSLCLITTLELSTDSKDAARPEHKSDASSFVPSPPRKQSSMSSDASSKHSRASSTFSSLRRVLTFSLRTSTPDSKLQSQRVPKYLFDDAGDQIIYDDPESIESRPESPIPRAYAGEKLRDLVDSGYDSKACEDTAISPLHVTSASDASSVYSTDVINESKDPSNSLLPAIRLNYDSICPVHADLMRAISTSRHTLHNADLLARTYIEEIGDSLSDPARITTDKSALPTISKPPSPLSTCPFLDMSKENKRSLSNGSAAASLKVHMDEDGNERQANEAEGSTDVAEMDRMEVHTKEKKGNQKAENAQHELDALVQETGKLSLANPLFRAALAADSSDEDDVDMMPAPLTFGQSWHSRSPGPWTRNKKCDPALAELFWRNNPAQGIVANRVLKGGVSRDIEGSEGVIKTPLDEALQRGEASRDAVKKYFDAQVSRVTRSAKSKDDRGAEPGS